MENRGEIRALTGLRGVAAVYVVAHHYTLGLPLTNPVQVFLAHGYLAVDLFFVLSGFVMALNYAALFGEGSTLASFRIFLARRLARVYPLYLATTLIATVLVMLHRLDWPPGLSVVPALLANLTMTQAWGLGRSLDGPGWSISTEWAAYLLFPLLLRWTYTGSGRRAKVVACLAAAAVVLLSVLPAGAVHRGRPLALLDFHTSIHGEPLWRCFPEFVLGLVTARLWLTQRQQRLRAAAWAAPATSGVLLVLLGVLRSDALVVLLCPVLILTLSEPANAMSRFLSWKPIHTLGVLSYSIYLLHELLAGLVAEIHHACSARGIAHGQTVGAVVAAGATLGLSWGAYRFLEKPGRRVLRGWFEPSRPVREPMVALPL